MRTTIKYCDILVTNMHTSVLFGTKCHLDPDWGFLLNCGPKIRKNANLLLVSLHRDYFLTSPVCAKSQANISEFGSYKLSVSADGSPKEVTYFLHQLRGSSRCSEFMRKFAPNN